MKLPDTLHKQLRYTEHEDVSCQKYFFGKVTDYLTKPFCMAFVFLIEVFVIDRYCVG